MKVSIMKQLFIIFSILFCVDSLVAREVSLRFSVVQLIGDSSKLQTQEGESIQLRRSSPSSAVKCTVNKKNQVFLYAEGVDPKNPEAKPLCVVRIPTNLEQGNVVLTPKKDEGMYSGYVLDYAKFKGGSICFLNTTGAKVGMVIGKSKRKVSIKPRGYTEYSPTIRGKKNVRSVLYYQDKEGEWRDFYGGTWQLNSDLREVMIIYYDSHLQKLALRGIVDI